MKWKTVPSCNHLSSDGSWEPLELRNLKKRLGNIRSSCHCQQCEMNQTRYSHASENQGNISSTCHCQLCEMNQTRYSHESDDHNKIVYKKPSAKLGNNLYKGMDQIVCQEPAIKSLYSKQINNGVQAMSYDKIVSHKSASESFILQYTNQDGPAKDQNIIIVCQKPPDTSNIPQYINQSTQATANNTIVCKESEKKSSEIETVSSRKAPVVNSGTTTDSVHVPGNILGCFNKELTCPSCFLTVNLLKNGLTKILKDEEVETEVKMLCDKSINNIVVCVEKTTSFYWKPVLKYTSAWSSDLTSIDSGSSSACRLPREVTFTRNDSIFRDDKDCELCKHCNLVSSELPNPFTVIEIDEVGNGVTDVTQIDPELLDKSSMFITTIPMEKYIDLIRPPMDNFFR